MHLGELWQDQTIVIPEELASAYLAVLNRHGLLARATGPRPDSPPVGGLSQEQTDAHFCHAFDGSLARIQLVYADPLGTIPVASQTLRNHLIGGDLCLVDVPAGAGAGALSLLCSVAKLRERGTLPRLPLNVRLLWGEISTPAMQYAFEVLTEVVPYLESQAIFVEVDQFVWDVLSQVSNTNLVEKIIQSRIHHPLVLLLVCNFSGFLEREGKWGEAKLGIENLIQFCSGDLNAAVWIEPDQSAVKSSLFGRIGKLLQAMSSFGRTTSEDSRGEFANSNFLSFLVENLRPRVNARALPIDLERLAG